jgi:mono/diheme cytochrome c family protein
LLNQNTDGIQLQDADGRPHSFAKSALRSFELEDTSPMPAFGERLTGDELSDVLAYLLSLRGLE